MVKDPLLPSFYICLKGSDYGVNEQFPPEIEQRRRRLYPIMKEERRKRANVVLKISYTLMMKYSDHSYICLLGDFNARTGDDLDFTTYEEFSGRFDLNDVSLNTLASSNINILRKNMDEKKNNFGNIFLQLFRANNLFICNGRIWEDKYKGQFTCENVSVVDYVIGSANCLTLFQNFSNLETSKLFSDAHTPLSLSMCIYENEKRNHFKRELHIN
ncbi:unnamed protein product [Mytilus edulis]|uniref:Endonuclease/exonuclease/phosphatase domain-containing protein n=1 Tax=Mytilus edulis TaxID=6550 RepID=A0A8S3TMM4_MYTED|nr:unnamed protein product [Mytilus edulis]